MQKEPWRDGQPHVAIVGGGISGLGAALLLSGTHRVTLFEAAPRLGGHARTVVAGRRGDQPVDTGFIVFNRPNYPRLTTLFERLGVEIAPSDMSFAASVRGGRVEYGLRDLAAVVAQRSNLVRPQFLRMIRDIVRFNARAARFADDPLMTVRDLLVRLGSGPWFREYYLLPLSGAIWSTPTRGVLDFPAQAMVRFFRNHALLSHTGQHRWYTVAGGSEQYVRRLADLLGRRGAKVRTDARVAGVRRRPGAVEVRLVGGAWQRFDDVVLATHADDALRLLSDATGVERTALGAFRYQANEAVLHADPSVMPRRRRIWSSWNYAERPGAAPDRIELSYWMNSLQPIPRDDQMFVTLNPGTSLRPDLIYDVTTFRHPVYDHLALAAQETVRVINGAHGTWFCGAWMRNGFHEDALASAAEVARGLADARRTAIAAA